MLKLFASACLVLSLAMPVTAGEAGDITREALYAGGLEKGLADLAPFRERLVQEGAFGIGFIRFVSAVEHLAKAFYRHGFAAPDGGPVAGPQLELPVPANSAPQPLDYPGYRAILSRFVADMDAARASLLEAGETGDYVVPVDLARIRIDLDADGSASEAESIGNVLAAAFGMRPDASTGPAEAPDLTIGFDRADAIWLAGYTQVLAAQADFLLAHDFESFTAAAFHRLFPSAGFPMQPFMEGNSVMLLDPESDKAIADLIAAVHTINWPVTEPMRLKRVLERLKSVTALSRRNWDAILAETDDNRELVPSPRQTSIVPDAGVTDETVAAWRATLDAADAILDGRLLVPHWRFRQGFDLRAYFENATRTDLVMLLTGLDALPFLRDGPVASADSFAEANRVFGDQLFGYAFWFN
ncbi:hypothetical protein [Devosia sp.]|uniref:hypothetical protein n=1 Tax=Devosia sp. TaxID=1871048 RepID=UPI0035B2EAB9